MAKNKILLMLEQLRRTTGGAALYSHLEGLLGDLEQHHSESETAYRNLIDHLVTALATRLPADSPLLIQLKLLKMSLAPPVTTAELTRLGQHLETLSEAANQELPGASQTVEKALHHLIDDLGLNVGGEAAPAEQSAAETPSTAANESPPQVDIPLEGDESRQVDNKRQRFQEVQKTLAQQVTEVTRQNEEFGVFLEVELEALRQAANIQEVGNLRQMLCKEVEKLLQRHRSLADKLDRSQSYLQIIETDSQLLTDELTRVHLLSLTDELTGLPNRRAFTRRLEDEVARVQRYGYPLSLALIDLDGFKGVNDEYGHAAGDEVLRSFASNILSMFRHHDMVSRYGGEEFAVLLPNTDVEGAMRALSKVQKRATETTFQYNGTTLPLPTFSAGLALYKPGETPGNLIERADGALYRAKRLGRNRIEQGAHEGADRAPKKG